MIITKVNVNLDGVVEKVNKRFGKPSEGLRKITEIVFLGSDKYLPYDTGEFAAASLSSSLELFKFGGITYVAPEGVRSDLPQWLWQGGYPKPIKRYTKDTHPLAGARWTLTAKSIELQKWINDFQEAIDLGLI